MNLPHWDGWHLIGRYDSDVGSWLLHHGDEAMLLEVPEGLTVADVQAVVDRLGVKLRYVTASHSHWDHLDEDVWAALKDAFPHALFIHPALVRWNGRVFVGGEPVWLIKAPKHSEDDVVTVFRGVAMVGDVELGMLESVNDEVPERTRAASMRYLAGFEDRVGYHVHTTVSAHLNDVRQGICWRDLFTVRERAEPARC